MPTEQSIFAAALEKLPGERAAFLVEACAGDAGLLARVQRLLFIDEATAGVLERGPIAEGPGLAADRIFAGRFKLRQMLGEGGMGEVWVADQIEPVQRRVAIKVIRPGLDSRSMLARFEQERQALALMDHINIARVLDAGIAHDSPGQPGRPYFVMELIKGVSLTQYCDDAKLSTRERLELFVPVCQAVQHAHQKGIIHRDLKPSNILVGLYDGRPVPKVIDFGVAKATGAQLTDQSIFTEVGSLIGTLEYMSPEQAELNNLDIDTRSDIYALGAVLYELLTGSVPFSRKELLSTGVGEMLRAIKQVEPAKPSTRLSTSGMLPSVAAVRQTDPKKLIAQLRGELDWIVGKCLEKERGRRYETASSLAQDLQRYLADETVTARPPSAGYRLRKFVRRHRGPVAAATLAVLLLAGGIVGTSIGLVRAGHAQQAEANRAEAEKQARGRAEQAETVAEERRRLAEGALREANNSLYVNAIAFADREWQAGSVVGAEKLLDSCPPDLRGWEWYYLKRRCHAEVLSLLGHTNLVTSVAYSPGGNRIVSGSRDRTVRIWDVRTGKELLKLEGHKGPVGGVAWSPAGNRIASIVQLDPVRTPEELASAVFELKIWDATTGKELRTLPGYFGVAFSPDGRRVASVAAGRTIKVWDVETGQESLSLSGHQYSPVSIAWSRDGRLLASSSTQFARSDEDRRNLLTGNLDLPGEVKLWDVANGKETVSLRGPVPRPMTIDLGADGKRLAINHAGGLVTIWDTKDGRLVYTLHGRTVGSDAAVFSPDGRWVAAISSPFEPARFWDVASGREVLALRGVQECLAFSPDGRQVATAAPNNQVKIWDLGMGQEGLRLQGPKSIVVSVALSPDGQRLAAVSNDYTLRVWNTNNGREVFNKPCKATRVVFHPDGKHIATAGGDTFNPEKPGTISIWNASTGDEVKKLPDGHPTMMFGLAYSPDGQRLLSTACHPFKLDQPGSVKLQDVTTGREVWSRPSSHHVNGVAYSPDGNRIALAMVDKTTRILDAETGREVLVLKDYADPLRSVAFSPDGQWIASGTLTGDLHVHDATTGQPVWANKGAHSGVVMDLVFSPDGRRLASVTIDGGANKSQVKLWDVGTGRQVFALPGILTVAFSGDGRRLAAVGWKAMQAGVIHVWDSGTSTNAGNDLKKLTGTWELVSVVEDGKAFGATELKGQRTVVDATGRWEYFKDGKSQFKGTYLLDPARKQKEIDSVTEGSGTVDRCIYEVDGDTWKQCFRIAGPRPTKFESPPGSGVYLIEMKRAR